MSSNDSSNKNNNTDMDELLNYIEDLEATLQTTMAQNESQADLIKSLQDSIEQGVNASTSNYGENSTVECDEDDEEAEDDEEGDDDENDPNTNNNSNPNSKYILELEEALEANEFEMSELTQQLHTLQTSASNTHVNYESSQNTINELTDELDSLQHEYQSEQDKNKRIKRKFDYANDTINVLNDELNDLRNVRNDSDEASKLQALLQSKYDDANDTINVLTTELHNYNAKYNNAQDTIDRLTLELSSLRSEYRLKDGASSTLMTSVTTQNNHLTTENASLRNTHMDMLQQVKSNDVYVEKVKEEFRVLIDLRAIEKDVQSKIRVSGNGSGYGNGNGNGNGKGDAPSDVDVDVVSGNDSVDYGVDDGYHDVNETIKANINTSKIVNVKQIKVKKAWTNSNEDGSKKKNERSVRSSVVPPSYPPLPSTSSSAVELTERNNKNSDYSDEEVDSKDISPPWITANDKDDNFKRKDGKGKEADTVKKVENYWMKCSKG